MKEFLRSLPPKFMFAALYFGFFVIGGDVNFLETKTIIASIFVIILIFFSDVIYRVVANWFSKDNSGRPPLK